MKITGIIWLARFVEKLEREHNVSVEEVEQVKVMPSARSKTKAGKQRDLLPEHFASLEEAAEFWDTHDSADYEEYMRDVECEIEIKHRQFLISLDSDLFRKVSSIAQAKGISSETLVNLWVQEKAS